MEDDIDSVAWDYSLMHSSLDHKNILFTHDPLADLPYVLQHPPYT